MIDMMLVLIKHFFLRANRRDLVKLETMRMYCWWVGKSELMAMVSALIF